MKDTSTSGVLRRIGGEWLLALSLATCAVFAVRGEFLFAHLAEPVWFALLFLWLFGVILASALAVVRHADAIAEVLGEPSARWC